MDCWLFAMGIVSGSYYILLELLFSQMILITSNINNSLQPVGETGWVGIVSGSYDIYYTFFLAQMILIMSNY